MNLIFHRKSAIKNVSPKYSRKPNSRLLIKKDIARKNEKDKIFKLFKQFFTAKQPSRKINTIKISRYTSKLKKNSVGYIEHSRNRYK